MKTRKLFWLFALSIMAVVFAACGGDAAGGDGGDGGDGGNTDAGASSAVDLSQTATLEGEEIGGTLSVNYPEGWAFQDLGGAIMVGSSEEVLAIEDPSTAEDVPAGSIIVNVSAIPAEMAGFMGLDADSTPADAVGVFTEFMSGEDGPEFSEVEEVELDGTPAASITGADEQVSITLYAVAMDGNFIISFGATRPDEVEQHADVIRAIAASAEFTPSEEGEAESE